MQRRYGGREYSLFHAPRFAVLLKLAGEFVPSGSSRILDIGVSEFTQILRDVFGDRVDTLDLAPDSVSEGGRQFSFDLSLSDQPGSWREDMPRYGLILMAEVMEHVYVSPLHQLRFLRSLLEPGAVLIVQTPNALSMQKRLKALAGVHPYERIRESEKFGGHVREYTSRELREYASLAGFQVVRLCFGSYFDARHKGYAGRAKGRPEASLSNCLNAALPARLRPGITMVLRAGDC